MTRITEHSIEELSMELLDNLGYEFIYAPKIAPDGETLERETYEQVLLVDRLKNAVKRINNSISAGAQAAVIREFQRIASPELLANNKAFHRLLTEGSPVSHQVDVNERGDRSLSGF